MQALQSKLVSEAEWELVMSEPQPAKFWQQRARKEMPGSLLNLSGG